MKKSLVLILFPVLISCNTDEPNCCTNIDTNILIKYLDDQGQNLLESGVYSESNINIYHLIDGSWERYFNGFRDSPKGITVNQLEDGLYLTLSPSSTTNTSGISETKIEFSENDFDVIKAEIEKSSNSQIITKVWYNDQLKWEAYATERKFEVVK